MIHPLSHTRPIIPDVPPPTIRPWWQHWDFGPFGQAKRGPYTAYRCDACEGSGKVDQLCMLSVAVSWVALSCQRCGGEGYQLTMEPYELTRKEPDHG